MQFDILKKKPAPYLVGGWLSSDYKTLNNWLADKVAIVNQEDAPLLPVIAEFKEFIESDPEVYMLFHMMFDEVPIKYNPIGNRFSQAPAPNQHVTDYKVMLKLLNYIMTHIPQYSEVAEGMGLVGLPINTMLDWQMGTTAGFAAFMRPDVNKHIKKILNAWAVFLKSPASCTVLNTSPQGWLGDDAMKALTLDMDGNTVPNPREKFIGLFECDPDLPYYGFTSWDDFFTRRFRAGARLVSDPDDDDVITNVCESAPYRIASDVKLLDNFWIKGQPYSLRHMLAGDPLTEQFIGGTVYQAYLSATSYHRWHSPVTGTILKAYKIPGTYYAEAKAEGYDPHGPTDSQGYLTHVATRAVIFIEADNPAIGLMCVMLVGMAEVSTCDVTAYVGQRIRKGEELGMFHFGGSTHCLIFRPETRLKFELYGHKPGLNADNIFVKKKIASVERF